jgi:hypothetical protein
MVNELQNGFFGTCPEDLLAQEFWSFRKKSDYYFFFQFPITAKILQKFIKMRKWQKYKLKRAKLMFLKEPRGNFAFDFFLMLKGSVKCKNSVFKILHRKREIKVNFMQ